ncbi:MAG: cytochrome c3 family protein [Labilithrix sp.]|nr:cytochrome c3 family protein [Labilithrix sp.]MCW5815671.1 cytochrome c3 family protein [Labilithrix sp.]
MNLFPASANSVYWVAIAALSCSFAGAPAAAIVWARTPYATGAGEPATQPVKFDHRHHVRDAAIDCVYCHDGALRAPVAGVPATSLCMGCHAQIWTDSPELASVRASALTDTPLRWQRTNALPDFVFFDHAAHTTQGVGCVTCHGRVDRMGQVFAARALTMDFCLDCHRDPKPELRPLDRITDMDWERDETSEPAAPVRSLVHCSTCHR